MKTRFSVTAGNNSTDLGRVGTSATIGGAQRIGRRIVLERLPNKEGSYKIINSAGCELMTGERSLRTAFKLFERAFG